MGGGWGEGHNKFWGSFNFGHLSVSHAKGGRGGGYNFDPFKGRTQTVSSCLDGGGGGANNFGLAIFTFVPPSAQLMTGPCIR